MPCHQTSGLFSLRCLLPQGRASSVIAQMQELWQRLMRLQDFRYPFRLPQFNSEQLPTPIISQITKNTAAKSLISQFHFQKMASQHIFAGSSSIYLQRHIFLQANALKRRA
jgi:hypothetical protein